MSMKKSKLLAGMSLLTVVLLLAACSSAGSGTVSAPATAAAEPSTAPATPTTEPTAVPEPTAAIAPTTAAEPTAATEPTTAATEPTPTTAAVPAGPAKLNLNTASGDDYLKAIPGFSSRMVREFLEYRPYVSIQQFRREIGKYVDDAVVAEYEKYVYVPVDVNESDAATLQQLPGVDATIADQLIAGRPYASPEAFLAQLATRVTAAQAAEAQGYLAE